jgi:8-oxo-dGTP pyrophosphatase MutT (NUDIX family)
MNRASEHLNYTQYVGVGEEKRNEILRYAQDDNWAKGRTLSSCNYLLRRYNIGLMEDELKQILAQRTKRYITDNNRLPSAVLIPIYKHDGQYYIVFIKRTNKVKTHKGQISFPGGMRDKGDKTLRDTALRESVEEIGLRQEDIAILGELDDEITTTSNFIVTPFIASVPYPYHFTPNKAEVAKIISVPVTALLDKDNRKPETETLSGKKVESFAYYYRGTRIWGATARILNKLLGIIENLSRK